MTQTSVPVVHKPEPVHLYPTPMTSTQPPKQNVPAWVASGGTTIVRPSQLKNADSILKSEQPPVPTPIKKEEPAPQVVPVVHVPTPVYVPPPINPPKPVKIPEPV